MKRNRGLATALVAFWLSIHVVISPDARAEDLAPGVDASATAISVIASAVAVPVRALACAFTVAIGGVAYGFTMGTSELVRKELVAGTNYTCGGKFTISPQEVKQLFREPERPM